MQLFKYLSSCRRIDKNASTLRCIIQSRQLSSSPNKDKQTTAKDGHYDVIIVGGGGAGIAMAGAIRKSIYFYLCFAGSVEMADWCLDVLPDFTDNNSKLSDRSVLLLDGAPKFKGYNESTYSNRVFAINHNTVDLMKAIGAWETITSIRCQPVKQMQASGMGRGSGDLGEDQRKLIFLFLQVWDGSSDAIITFNHDNFSDNVAYIVENDVLLHAILQEIARNPNITIQNDSKIDKVRLRRDGFANNMVYLKNGQTYSSDLLVSE